MWCQHRSVACPRLCTRALEHHGSQRAAAALEGTACAPALPRCRNHLHGTRYPPQPDSWDSPSPRCCRGHQFTPARQHRSLTPPAPAALTSACPPGVRVLLQRSHFRQNLCQSLPREDTFSAARDTRSKGSATARRLLQPQRKPGSGHHLHRGAALEGTTLLQPTWSPRPFGPWTWTPAASNAPSTSSATAETPFPRRQSSNGSVFLSAPCVYFYPPRCPD